MSTKEFTDIITESVKWLVIIAIMLLLGYGLITVPSLLLRRNTNDLIYISDQKSKAYIESVSVEIARDYVDYMSKDSSQNQKDAIKASACSRYETIKDRVSSPWASICK